jgi:hypothetical protein
MRTAPEIPVTAADLSAKLRKTCTEVPADQSQEQIFRPGAQRLRELG